MKKVILFLLVVILVHLILNAEWLPGVLFCWEHHEYEYYCRVGE